MGLRVYSKNITSDLKTRTVKSRLRFSSAKALYLRMKLQMELFFLKPHADMIRLDIMHNGAMLISDFLKKILMCLLAYVVLKVNEVEKPDSVLLVGKCCAQI